MRVRANSTPMAIVIGATTVLLMVGCGGSEDAEPETVTAGSVSVSQAWLQSSSSGETPISAEIDNSGTQTEILVDVTSPVCSSTAMHEVVDVDGVARDRVSDGLLTIPAGTSSVLSPDSVHFSCQDPTLPLTDGMTVEVTFTFENAGKVVVTAEVFD